ncbi:MAG: serine/threonine protein kinase [Candidatus Paceibacteria bacterium]|jgi:serine/threonine protein kinase
MSGSSLTLFDLVPGKVLADRYRIKESFRQGGMSATFIVADAETDEDRELQVFPAALFDKKQQADEFADHLRAWCEIASPAVLGVHEVIVREDGSLFLVTDVPCGGSMRDWISEHKHMALPDVLTLGLHLLHGLEQIHAAGQVHGDIKPHSIHMDGGPSKAVLVDGGITSGLWSAKHLGDKTALIGTPFYAPIEQFGGESPDVQSDIYNVATVLYELCTGVVPWPGSSFLEIFQAKLEKRPPSMTSRNREIEVPSDMENAIVGGLLADRRERYSDAKSFRAALEEVAAL